jgi:HlyD family secretion protein
VRIVLENRNGLLKPGMNAEVSILVTERKDVLAVPTGALRTNRDLNTAAALVGLDEATAAAQLKANALPEKQGSNGASRAGGTYQFSNRYWVFVNEGGKPVARPVVTGITDLDYNEVLEGLKQGDQVYLLPSSGLVETQQRFQQQMRNMTGMPGLSGGGRQGSQPGAGQSGGSRPEGGGRN